MLLLLGCIHVGRPGLAKAGSLGGTGALCSRLGLGAVSAPVGLLGHSVLPAVDFSRASLPGKGSGNGVGTASWSSRALYARSCHPLGGRVRCGLVRRVVTLVSPLTRVG